MTYKGNAFGRELSRANEGTLSVLIRAVLFTALTLCACLLLPQSFGPAAVWQNGLFGCAVAYVSVSVVLSMVLRIFGGKLYSYDGLREGRWALAKSCGASVGKLVRAKYFAGLWAALVPYVLGAVLTLGIRILLGSSAAQLADVPEVLAVGLLTLVCLSSLLAVFGALGVRGKGLCIMALPISAALLAVWWIAGFFSAAETGVQQLLQLPLGLPLAAAVLLVLSLIICFAVPQKRVSRFAVEELDDEMLRQLGFPHELEVYQKDGEEYELIFSGKDIAGN